MRSLTLPMPVMKLVSTLRVHLAAPRLIASRAQLEHVGHRVDDRADHAALDVEHDHDGEGVVLGAVAAELQAQVDDRHDHAAQVDHALDERRRVGDAGRLLVASGSPAPQDVDAVFLGAEAEGQELAAGCGCAAALPPLRSAGFVAGRLTWRL